MQAFESQDIGRNVYVAARGCLCYRPADYPTVDGLERLTTVKKDFMLRVTGQQVMCERGGLWMELDPVWSPKLPPPMLAANWFLWARKPLQKLPWDDDLATRGPLLKKWTPPDPKPQPPPPPPPPEPPKQNAAMEEFFSYVKAWTENSAEELQNSTEGDSPHGKSDDPQTKTQSLERAGTTSSIARDIEAATRRRAMPKANAVERPEVPLGVSQIRTKKPVTMRQKVETLAWKQALLAVSGDGEGVQGSSNQWVVVGGVEQGGILVRRDEDMTSPKVALRLQTGATLGELEVVGNRLHYQKLDGQGPEEGWVSIMAADGRALVELV